MATGPLARDLLGELHQELDPRQVLGVHGCRAFGRLDRRLRGGWSSASRSIGRCSSVLRPLLIVAPALALAIVGTRPLRSAVA
jgi:hypothetical protein